MQPIERKPRKFNPQVIPQKLQAALPFASKPKDMPSRKRPLLETRRAVVVEPHERKIISFVQHLQLIKNDKVISFSICEITRRVFEILINASKIIIYKTLYPYVVRVSVIFFVRANTETSQMRKKKLKEEKKKKVYEAEKVKSEQLSKKRRREERRERYRAEDKQKRRMRRKIEA